MRDTIYIINKYQVKGPFIVGIHAQSLIQLIKEYINKNKVTNEGFMKIYNINHPFIH